MHVLSEVRLKVERGRVFLQVANYKGFRNVARIIAVETSKGQRRATLYGVQVQPFVVATPRRTDLVIFLKNDEVNPSFLQTSADGEP
jgi:hypothetical protein